ncbi:hypothetical protein [Reyranella sp.]|uniref:hypothetical protein n=1 Tax=Reyranella sp. TaxID=1929291 RepID=UPI00378428AD
MKQRIFGWITVLVGFVLALAMIEVAAIALLYVEEGRYTPAAELFQRTQNTYVRDATKGTSCRYVDTLYPHPYVAFVHHANPPCGMPWVNNIGLFGPDYPVLKNPDRYTVILIGGSVASQLAQNQAPPAPRYLEEELNRKYVSPNGKPWQVLNGGDGAWKEPQPFILFSLYAGSVDAMVSLGGFNEHYDFRPYSSERIEAPASNFLDVNPFVADENFGDAAIGWVMGRLAGSLALNPVLGHSHAAYLIIRGIEASAKGQDTFKSSKKTSIRGMFALPQEVREDPNRLFDVQLALYQKYMRAEQVVAADNKVKTAYFLQPIPAWGKVLTEEEKRVVGDLSYGELYRRIVAGILTLRPQGLPIYDLGDVFANEKGTIYADHIHYWRDDKNESPGNRLVAARIGEKLAETWGLQRKP